MSDPDINDLLQALENYSCSCSDDSCEVSDRTALFCGYRAAVTIAAWNSHSSQDEREAVSGALLPLSSPPEEPASGWRDMNHAANEWADAFYAAVQWIKNIDADISTPAEALVNLEHRLAQATQPAGVEREAIDRKCLTPGCTYSTHLSSYSWDSKCTSIKIHIGLSAPLRVPRLGMCYLPKGNKTTKEEYLQRVEDILHDNLEHAVAEIGEFDLLCGGIMAKTWPSLARLRSPAPEWRPISEASEDWQERIADAWNEFFGDNLTDGNDGYREAKIINLCRAAFDVGVAAAAPPTASTQEG